MKSDKIAKRRKFLCDASERCAGCRRNASVQQFYSDNVRFNRLSNGLFPFSLIHLIHYLVTPAKSLSFLNRIALFYFVLVLTFPSYRMHQLLHPCWLKTSGCQFGLQACPGAELGEFT